MSETQSKPKAKFLQLERIYDPHLPPMRLGQQVQFDRMFSPNIVFTGGRFVKGAV